MFIDLNLRSLGEEDDDAHIAQSAPEIRDVFGESDDEEPAEYAVENQIENDSNVCISCKKFLSCAFHLMVLLVLYLQ